MSVAQRIHKATMFVADAERGDELRAHRVSKWYRRVDMVTSSSWFEAFMTFVVRTSHCTL